MLITSKDNEFVKSIKKLKDKKYRDERKEFIIEGIRMIKEAILEKAKIKTIVVCDDCASSGNIPSDLLYEIAKYDVVYVTEKVFNTITDVATHQGILAVIERTATEESISYDEDIIVVLDDIQDPGNMGTILRTVDSIGLSQILVSKGTTDSYNPKVVRSTMGAIFRVNVIECENLEKTVKELKKHKYDICATCLEESKSLYDTEFTKTAVIIGNEGNGVSEQLLNIADKKIKIPMLGKTESLNASVATGIVLYEIVRQKLKK